MQLRLENGANWPGFWTQVGPILGMNPGMTAFSETKNWAHLQLRFKPSSYPLAGEGSGEEDGVSVSFPT